MALFTDPEAWSAIADAYDVGGRRRLTRFSEIAVDWASLKPDDAVLDVACGPGTTSVLIAPRVARLEAVDFAPNMVRKWRQNLADHDHASVATGDGQALTFEDASFDAAFSMFGLMFFPDPIAGLRELRRVLKPGGQAFVSSWVPLPESPSLAPLMQAMMAVSPPPPDAPPMVIPFQSAASLEQGFREAGFDTVEVRPVSPMVPTGGPEGYWREMRSNLFMNAKRRELGEAWPAFEAAMQAKLTELLDGVEALAMPAFIARGVKT